MYQFGLIEAIYSPNEPMLLALFLLGSLTLKTYIETRIKPLCASQTEIWTKDMQKQFWLAAILEKAKVHSVSQTIYW